MTVTSEQGRRHAVRSELFHVCLVVPEIEAARAHFSELLGIEWGPLREFDFAYREADGTEAVAVGYKICYSLAAPHLELVNAMPGTPWECNEHSNVHHLGYLVNDMEASSNHLGATRCPMGGHGVDPTSGALAWAYHRDDLGLQLEIIDAAGAAWMGPRMLGGTTHFDAPLTTSF